MKRGSAKLVYMLVAVSLVFLQVRTARGIIVDRIVAKVNDDIITLSEVQEKGLPLLSRIRSGRGGDSKELKKAEKEILEQLIDIELQLQEARALGMTVSETEVEKTLKDIKEKNNITQEALERMLEEEGTDIESYKAEIRDRLLLQKIYYFRVIASAKVSRQQIESYYKEHISQYTGPEKVKVRQIFFAVDPANPAKREDVVRARALEVMERIKAGEDFASLARAYSEGPNTARGGELGFFKRGEALPILEQTMFRLNSGMVSELIRSKAGFHILKVDEHVYPKPLPLKEVEKEITDIIKKEKAQENYERWIKKLRGEAFIEITYDLSESRR
jgi:peptidyl-prolyl cis-trans isomerase SurA